RELRSRLHPHRRALGRRRVRAQQLLRLRRHQRRARLSKSRLTAVIPGERSTDYPPSRHSSSSPGNWSLGMRDSLRHFVAEFVGAFGLVFIGGGAIMAADLAKNPAGITQVALAHGLILALMVT